MATGAEHYLEAESILAERLPHYEHGKAAELLAEAQVHAALALAAAIGVSMAVEIGGEQAMPQEDSEAWIDAASAIRRRSSS